MKTSPRGRKTDIISSRLFALKVGLDCPLPHKHTLNIVLFFFPEATKYLLVREYFVFNVQERDQTLVLIMIHTVLCFQVCPTGMFIETQYIKFSKEK